VIGFDDAFTEHGDPAKLMAQYGLNAAGIQKTITERWPDQTVSPILRRVV